MRRKGVLYDAGRVLGLNWRPSFDREVVHRELQIIHDDLHCNAVKICARDLDRLAIAASHALELGLEVWFSPELWDRGVEETLAHIGAAAARAERLRRRWPDRVVFSVATESTLFMRGIIKGRRFRHRVATLRDELRVDRHRAPLRAFLSRAARAARAEFNGPITYASLPFEPVDWSEFDIIGVDHYRDARTAPRYLDTLERLAVHGKPVVVTEFGMRTYTGADCDGNIGTGLPVDVATFVLHQLPLVGRLIHPRLRTAGHTRDEALQARRIAEDLAILDSAGVDGAFVCTFVEQRSVHSPKARYDLDMGALSLVKSYATGRGTTYPDMPWEPKQSFHAVADFFSGVRH